MRVLFSVNIYPMEQEFGESKVSIPIHNIDTSQTINLTNPNITENNFTTTKIKSSYRFQEILGKSTMLSFESWNPFLSHEK